MLSSIIQYFLEKRSKGYWVNTVESASILEAILPEILAMQKDFTKPASLTIAGDTSFVVSKFPFKFSSTSSSIKNLNITKSGGGMVYFTAYQKVFNTTPLPQEKYFTTSVYFQQAGVSVSKVKAGEKVKMIVTIDAKKDAEYLMVDVPIPAGCIYANKSNYVNGVYREFFKDKVSMFIESFATGKHTYEIELEPRYNGNYILNPTKVSLMYFPTFYGRNKMDKVQIVGE
jgi:alpha-2-macroglobulin